MIARLPFGRQKLRGRRVLLLVPLAWSTAAAHVKSCLRDSAAGMARFVQGRRADGVCILNVRRCHPLRAPCHRGVVAQCCCCSLWEKLVLVARVIVAVPDAKVIPHRPAERHHAVDRSILIRSRQSPPCPHFISHPVHDVAVISQRANGCTPALQFSRLCGATALPTRFIPGTFTNQVVSLSHPFFALLSPIKNPKHKLIFPLLNLCRLSRGPAPLAPPSAAGEPQR
jgi:hypothetical protein